MIILQKVKFLLVILLLELLFSASTYSQTYKAWMNAGDKAIATGNYAEAIEYFTKATDYEVEDARLYFQLGNAFRLYNDYNRAAFWYQKTYSIDDDKLYPEAIFYIGEMKKYMGKYDETTKYYNIYISNSPADSSYMAHKARSEVSMMETSKKIASNVNSDVKVENAGNRVNTTYSDFGGYMTGDSMMYYSSLRFKYDDKKEKKTKYVSRILKNELENNKFQISQPLFMTINEPSMHNCNVVISPDHKLMVFTRCERQLNYSLRCDLYYARYTEGKWADPKPFPVEVNDAEFTNTHPAIETRGADGYRIYFASDRPNGFGKLDLYSVDVDGNYNFTPPLNLGEVINTYDDEASPFYDSARDILFFSSYGHANMGGFDIFYSKNFNEVYSEPKNLGPPYNSSVNDLYFTLSHDSLSGTLTSNRIGSYYIRSKTCCYDIYLYEFTPSQSVALTDSIKDSIPDVIAAVAPIADPMVRANYNDLLPLVLYFENDQPGRRSMAITTNESYETLYQNYINKYKEYVSGHAEGLSGDEYTSAITSVESFFREGVKASYNKLKYFSAQIHDALKKGALIKITVRGQASPLADSKYNVNLSKRRVWSLINYFNQYEDGVLQPYINSKNFLIEEVAAGEMLSDKSVSDNLKDTRNSVFSPEASKERLIEVIDIFIDVPEEK